MNNLVNFIIESGISLSLLALIYILFLRKETFFRTNRLFLLGSVVFSIVLPLLKFRVFAPQTYMLSEVTVTPYRNLLETVTIYSTDLSGTVEQAVLSSRLIVFAYVLGLIFFFTRFLYQIAQVLLTIKNGNFQPRDGFKLVIIEKETSPFSFLRYIFVSRSVFNREGFDRMLAHEQEHVKSGHTFDVLILEVLTVFQWFNPFMWILRRVIRENHEFLADQAVLTSGVNRGYYKKLLLDQFTGDQLVLANSFNYSLIKKRIKMMSKIKSKKITLAKTGLGILMAIALIVAFACEQKETGDASHQQVTETKSGELKTTILDDGSIRIEGNAEQIKKYAVALEDISHVEVRSNPDGTKMIAIETGGKKKAVITDNPKPSDSDLVFAIVEKMPEFPGGENELRSYIANNIQYPETAKKNGIQGKVYVTFVVSKYGTVKDAKIARGVDPSLDAEALRVISALPKWQPGTQRGETVNVSYTVPINFALK